MVRGDIVLINADMLTRVKTASVLIVVESFIEQKRSWHRVVESTVHKSVRMKVGKKG
jgi:hypothetical protein